jgi:hypothetical protein
MAPQPIALDRPRAASERVRQRAATAAIGVQIGNAAPQRSRAVDHGHANGSSTSFASTGFSSTYRVALPAIFSVLAHCSSTSKRMPKSAVKAASNRTSRGLPPGGTTRCR